MNPSDRETERPRTKRELTERAKEYAREVAAEHFPDFSLEEVRWEVSTRAKRRAGATKYNRETGEITISLTWAAYEELGWEDTRATIRHELIHAYQFDTRGQSGHGAAFRGWADRLDAPRHCPLFETPKWWVICTDCNERTPRYRRSKVVKHPTPYACSCGGSIHVEATSS